jgi:hypothetical protein
VEEWRTEKDHVFTPPRFSTGINLPPVRQLTALHTFFRR